MPAVVSSSVSSSARIDFWRLRPGFLVVEASGGARISLSEGAPSAFRLGGLPLFPGVRFSVVSGASDCKASLLATGVPRGLPLDLGVGVPFFFLLGPAAAGVPGRTDDRLRLGGVGSPSSSVRPLSGTVVVVVCGRPRRGLGWGVGDPNSNRLTFGPPTLERPGLVMGLPSGPASTVT
jgi:hypothetical protein